MKWCTRGKHWSEDFPFRKIKNADKSKLWIYPDSWCSECHRQFNVEWRKRDKVLRKSFGVSCLRWRKFRSEYTQRDSELDALNRQRVNV